MYHKIICFYIQRYDTQAFKAKNIKDRDLKVRLGVCLLAYNTSLCDKCRCVWGGGGGGGEVLNIWALEFFLCDGDRQSQGTNIFRA